MTVVSSSVQDVASQGQPSGDKASSKLGKDEFLKLLMAQMGAQDPLSPTDSSAFVAQLAQFANVEQLQGANTRLEGLLVAQAASNQTSTVALVGKDVTYKNDKVSVGATGDVSVQGDLSKDAASVTAVIKDSDGKVVRTLTTAGGTAGPLSLTYSVGLSASDAEKKTVAVEGHVRGRVSGITYENGVPRLMIGGLAVSLSDVIRVEEAVPVAHPTLRSTSFQ
jgi:flagellar basal-body rod modification protein FlgD